MTFDELLGSEFGPPEAGGAHTVRLPLREEHHGVHGFVHGGVLCSLAHQSAGAAVYAGCKAGEEAVMLEMKINFVAASWTGALQSRSQVLRRGSRVALVETRITGDDGELRATVTSTFLLLTRALRPAS
jgi:acyl-CoA thioesterase